MTALHVPDPPTGEEEVGMLGFLSATPGLGGRLKAEPEDFVVDEIQTPLPQDPTGRFSAMTVRLRNWETNRFVRQMSRRLAISSKRVRFAGVKDKRAITTQQMTVEASPESVGALRMPDVEVVSLYTTDRHLALGDLIGNRFTIRLSDLQLSQEDVGVRITAILDEVGTAGGFPNFYGPQRFGVSRPVSHLVGMELVHGDVESAVWTYLTHVGPGEDHEASAARRALAGSRDVREALRTFPKNLGHERNMLNHLLHQPDDPDGAMRRLPFNLQLMFVHAYQGMVFNRVVSERLRRDLPLSRPIEGDLLVPVDESGNPIHDRSIPVGEHNLVKAARQVERGRAMVSGIVPGTEIPMASGEMGEIEAAVMDDLGLEPGHFRIVSMTELTSSGIRRELAITGHDMEWEVGESDATFSFRLMKGCYATAVMRELMKSPLMSY